MVHLKHRETMSGHKLVELLIIMSLARQTVSRARQGINQEVHDFGHLSTRG